MDETIRYGHIRGGKNEFLAEIGQHKRFFQNLMYPQFVGMWIFAYHNSLEDWMRRYSPFLVNLGGTYVVGNTVWNFPWGAQLKLEVIHTREDNKKLRGIELSDVEIDSLQPSELDYRMLMAQLRIKPPEKRMFSYLPVLFVWSAEKQCWVFQANSLLGAAEVGRRNFQQSRIPTMWIKKWPYGYFPDKLPLRFLTAREEIISWQLHERITT